MSRQSTAEKPATEPAAKPDWAMSKREFERAWREREGLPKRRRKWPWVILVLLITAGAGYYYYSTKIADAPTAAVAPEAEPESIMQVNTAEMTTLEPRTLQRTVRAIGTLAPIRKAELSSQVSGRIEDVRVQPGDAVGAGDILIQIDVETLTLELDQARNNASATRAQLELAEVQLKRVQTLIDRGVSTASNFDEAESNVSALRASLSALEDQVSGAELRLRNATVRAPFDGIVSARAVEPGQYVSTGAPLLTIVDLTRMEMQGNAPVSAGSELRPGQSVSVRVDGIPGRSFDGEVVRINPVAEEGTRTIPAYIIIDNPERVLLGGMFATGSVVIEEIKDALAVPTVALREDAEGHHLLRIEGDRLLRAAVETGGTWAGGMTRITDGVEAGQMVVTAPLAELQDGDAVEIVEE